MIPKVEHLALMAADPAKAMEIGRAAEHLVVADLIMQGRRAFLTDQGLPYDVVVDMSGKLIRIQVKASCFPRNVNSSGKVPRIAYNWSVRRVGKQGRSRLSNTDCDIIALVALDIRSVAYLPVAECGTTVQLMPPGQRAFTKFKSKNSWGHSLEKFTFDLAVAGDVSWARRELTHCWRGHELTAENTYVDRRGARSCKTCARINKENRMKTEAAK